MKLLPIPPTARCKCGMYFLPNEDKSINHIPAPMHDCGGILINCGPIDEKTAREIYWESIR